MTEESVTGAMYIAAPQFTILPTPPRRGSQAVS